MPGAAGTCAQTANISVGRDGRRDSSRRLSTPSCEGTDLPLFYVHLKPKVNQFTRETETTVELVDGQQRLLAIKSYLDNEFALPDPAKEDPGTVLPTLVTSQPQPRWVGKRFEEMEPADKERLLGQLLGHLHDRRGPKRSARPLH